MKKVIKGVLVNTQTNEIKPYSFEYEETKFLPNIYELLGCECIDIVSRKFGEHTLDIICDDEGLLKEDQSPSIFTFNRHNLVEQLVGNVFICSSNDEGESISLTEEQVQSVLASIRQIELDGNNHYVLVATL